MRVRDQMPPMVPDKKATARLLGGWPLYPQGRREAWLGTGAMGGGPLSRAEKGKSEITAFLGSAERWETGACSALMIQKGMSDQPIQTKETGLEGPAREERAIAGGLPGSSLE